MQDINLDQLKLKVNDTYKKDEKKTTNFEPSNPEDNVNKTYLDIKLSKIGGHISNREKGYNEVKLHCKKQSEDEAFFERAVKTTIQILYDKGLFDKYDDADELLVDYLLIERRRLNSEEQKNDGVIQ